MNTSIKTPDRLNLTKKAREIINKIDENKYFGLETPTTSRSELFALAMAIGLETVPTKLENVYPGGLILDSNIESATKALMYAYFIGLLPDVNMIDNVVNKEYVYNIAQEYANTGFEILDDYMANKKDTDLLWDLIAELDIQYREKVDLNRNL